MLWESWALEVYGEWDCMKWSPRLHRGKQVGLIPTFSTIYLGVAQLGRARGLGP